MRLHPKHSRPLYTAVRPGKNSQNVPYQPTFTNPRFITVLSGARIDVSSINCLALHCGNDLQDDEKYSKEGVQNLIKFDASEKKWVSKSELFSELGVDIVATFPRNSAGPCMTKGNWFMHTM